MEAGDTQLQAGRAHTCVGRELPAHFDIAFTRLEAVDGAHVVKASTGHKIARGRIGTGHDPGGTQRDGMNLAGTETMSGFLAAERTGQGHQLQGDPLQHPGLQPPDPYLVSCVRVPHNQFPIL